MFKMICMQKKILLGFSFLFIALAVSAQPGFRVMTFNIRLDVASDSLNAWPHRKDKVASQILFHRAAIVGVQEALPWQMKELQALLPGYLYTGVGREDGKEKGEFSAIFYDSSLFTLAETATFWLSQTPDVAGSKGWDAALPRIVTWGKFMHKASKKQFCVFNTHYDHMGKEARRQSSLLLMNKVNTIAAKLPAIITGDFNAGPADEPVKLLTDTQQPFHFTDAEFISQTPHYGPAGTFNGWLTGDLHPKIDYIYIKGNLGVKKHATISEIWGTRFSSDHFPVLAEVVLN